MRGVVKEAVLGWWTRKARQRHLCPFIKKPVFSVQHCDVCSLVPNTVQECSAPIMSADVFELLIVKKQVSLVVSLPFYIQLSAHLQSPQEDISTELFTKVLSSQLQSSLNGCLSTNRPSVLGRLHSSCLMVASRLQLEVLCCPLSSSTQTPSLSVMV